MTSSITSISSFHVGARTFLVRRIRAKREHVKTFDRLRVGWLNGFSFGCLDQVLSNAGDEDGSKSGGSLVVYEMVSALLVEQVT